MVSVQLKVVQSRYRIYRWSGKWCFYSHKNNSVPNHPFENGQKVTINKRNGANRFDVGTTPLVTEFKLPFLGANSTEVFVINKGIDNIGLVTTKVGIGSDEGLFFYSKGSNAGINSSLYFIETQKEQITGDIDKVVTTDLQTSLRIQQNIIW